MRYLYSALTAAVAFCSVATAVSMLSESESKSAGAHPAIVPTAPTNSVLPACETEDQDAPDCFWDASKNGNREGRSFVVIDGEVYYLN